MTTEKSFWLGFIFFSTILLFSSISIAHDNEVHSYQTPDQRCILSNGLPDHDTGSFPNSGNPNAIKEQKVKLCVPLQPIKHEQATDITRGSVGVAINGVQIRPKTADYYDATSHRGFSRDSRSGWNLEGLGARDKLGMDDNNAHVDHRGLYHYHGVATALEGSSDNSLIGYAADGFEIHYLQDLRISSYQLKNGTRASGPGGKHDGTFVEDWEYIANSGNLDVCNGGYLDDQFVYFATDTYPFFPRCMWGEISTDFNPKRTAANTNSRSSIPRNNSTENSRPSLGPPQEAIAACDKTNIDDYCSFNSPRGDRISGNCGMTRENVVACRPENGGKL